MVLLNLSLPSKATDLIITDAEDWYKSGFLVPFLTRGSDAIILGAKTLRGLHPVETVSTVSRICAEAQLSFGENEHLP
uniref:Uncharacterized protein n=1 Tax=Cucumis melo TaxID=3656 RepID=A0A9I9E2E7_CUCME